MAPVLAPRGAKFENWGCRMGVLDIERRRETKVEIVESGDRSRNE